jgi:hypothetical protein
MAVIVLLSRLLSECKHSQLVFVYVFLIFYLARTTYGWADRALATFLASAMHLKLKVATSSEIVPHSQ